MNPGPTTSRIYEALRARLRHPGVGPGDRLDPTLIAAELGVSPTPVRDALHILTGEDIIATAAAGGFTVAMVHEPALADLYAWTGDILRLALAAPAMPSPSVRSPPHDGTLAGRSADLFDAIVRRSPNSEYHRAIDRTNLRLWRPRLVEGAFLTDGDLELDRLTGAHECSDIDTLRTLLRRYTRRRRAIVADVVRALYQRGASPNISQI